MNSPRRLAEDRGLDPFKRALLRSAEVDVPSPRTRRKARLALGLGASGSIAAGTAFAASSLSAASVVKFAAIGFAVGVVTIGGVNLGVHAIQHSKAPARTATVAAGSPVKSTLEQRHAMRVAPTGSRTASPTADNAPKPAQVPPASASEHALAVHRRSAQPRQSQLKPAAARRPKAAAVPSAQPSEDVDALRSELALLDEARRALVAGQPDAALQRLGQMQRQFPASSLTQEESLVRIEALTKMGARKRAIREAIRFAQAHPGSPYLSRLQPLLQSKSPK